MFLDLVRTSESLERSLSSLWQLSSLWLLSFWFSNLAFFVGLELLSYVLFRHRLWSGQTGLGRPSLSDILPVVL